MKNHPKTNFAKQLRRDSPPPEVIFWSHIRDRRFNGLKFRRQWPMGKYVVDFICLKKRMIVELDGSQHGSETAERHDSQRTKFLNDCGFQVIRFWNSDVLTNLDGVLEKLSDELGL